MYTIILIFFIYFPFFLVDEPQPLMSWSALGNGLGDPAFVYDMAADQDGNIYAAGNFIFDANGEQVLNVAKWDGTSWSNLGGGINGTIWALTVDALGNLYAGGSISQISGKRVNNIVRWDGASWLEVPGTNFPVRDLEFDNNGTLFAAGEFTVIGGISADYIAKFDGCNWSALDGNLNGDVYDIDFDDQNNLYAVGIFTLDIAGNTFLNRIGKWDGSSWSALGNGTGANQTVETVLVDNNQDIIIGGRFGSVDGVATNKIAKWDGNNWSPIGNSNIFNSVILTLSQDVTGNLYAGGGFSDATTNGLPFIARWDGTNWLDMDNGTDDIVRASVIGADQKLYIGGQFEFAGNTQVFSVARWDGPTTLPIDLETFELKRSGSTVELQWKTISEYNNYGFTVERSQNAINWEDLIFIKGAGNSSSPNQYHFVDNHPKLSINYYRIKQQDNDGSTSFLPIRSVDLTNLEVDPLVIVTFINDVIEVAPNHRIKEILLFNGTGQMLEKRQMRNNNSPVRFDLSKLDSGIYFLSLYGQDRVLVESRSFKKG